MPTAYTVRPANENEKRHFQALASKAKRRFRSAKWHIADSQYSSERLRKFVRESLKGRPVIAKRENERVGEQDFYVDRLFRCHGNPEMCRLYKRRTACERMNSRAERLVGRNTLRGLKKVKAYTGIALTLMLMIAAASYRLGKPWLARSIEYYASH
jgi:transposase